MNSLTKKILSISLRVVSLLLVVFTVFIMIFTIVSVTTVDRNDRNILGTRFYIVKTDSMKPTENNTDLKWGKKFNAGDIVVIKRVKDQTKLKDGDIIAFMSTNNDESYGQTVTHMIREVLKTEDGKLLGYVTFGTATGSNDEAVVEPSYVLGKYMFKLPRLGHFFAFMKTTPGYVTCILIPFLLLIIYNGVNVIRLFRKYRKEQLEEMETEKTKIAEERAKNEEKMKELLALKAQLEQNSNSTQPSSDGPADTVTPEIPSATAETPVEAEKAAETETPVEAEESAETEISVEAEKAAETEKQVEIEETPTPSDETSENI